MVAHTIVVVAVAVAAAARLHLMCNVSEINSITAFAIDKQIGLDKKVRQAGFVFNSADLKASSVRRD